MTIHHRSPHFTASQRGPRRMLLLLLASLPLLFALLPATAQNRLDIQVTIFSEPSGKETVAVAYDRKIPRADIDRDLAALAGHLRLPPPALKVTEERGIVVAEAELSGLTNWSTGTVNLDALINTFKRYGHFQVMCMFLGDFPLRTVENQQRGPVRVETQVNGSTVSYQIRVDQSHGVPKDIPSFNQRDALWPLVLGVVGLLAVLAACAYLIAYAIRARRRA